MGGDNSSEEDDSGDEEEDKEDEENLTDSNLDDGKTETLGKERDRQLLKLLEMIIHPNTSSFHSCR